MSRRDRLTQAEADQLEALDVILDGGAGVGTGPEHAELSRLVRAVRDDRPRLRPAFADELEARVSAGFAGQSAHRAPGVLVGLGSGRQAGRSLRRRLADGGVKRRWLVGLGSAASLAAGVAIVVGGLGSPQPRSASPQASSSLGSAVGGVASSPAGGASTPARTVPASPQPLQSNASAGLPAPLPTGGSRAVESDASVSLLAPRGQVQRVADGVIAATDRFGGVVESSHVSTGDGGGSQATLALAVPSAALDRMLAAISSLGHVSSRSQDTQDITDPTEAARGRLSESRDERVALLRQLGGASTPNQVASIHAQLGLVDGRITRDQASLKALVGRARTASVDVTIGQGPASGAGGVGHGESGSAWRPRRALDDAFGVLEACFAVLVIGLAALVPAAALVAACWWVLGVLRRRRRQGALAGL